MTKEIYFITFVLSIVLLVHFMPLLIPVAVFWGPLPFLQVAAPAFVGGYGLVWSVKGYLRMRGNKSH